MVIQGRSAVPSLLLVGALLACASGCRADIAELASLAPTAGDLDNWAPAGEIEVYEGLDLYELINGGAELYHEYGFRRVLSRDYGDAEGRFITLEIYEMESPAAAYGIYSFKTDAGAKTVAAGTESALEGYYLNVWKDRYLITVTGVDSTAATRNGLVRIGQAVAGRIPRQAPRPALMDLPPAEPRAPAKLRYVRGRMALMNITPMAGGCPFRVEEGVVADYAEHQVYVLAYADTSQVRQCFDAQMETQRMYLHPESDEIVQELDRTVLIHYASGTTVCLAEVGNYLLAIIAKDRDVARAVMDTMRDRLAVAAKNE